MGRRCKADARAKRGVDAVSWVDGRCGVVSRYSSSGDWTLDGRRKASLIRIKWSVGVGALTRLSRSPSLPFSFPATNLPAFYGILGGSQFQQTY